MQLVLEFQDEIDLVVGGSYGRAPVEPRPCCASCSCEERRTYYLDLHGGWRGHLVASPGMRLALGFLLRYTTPAWADRVGTEYRTDEVRDAFGYRIACGPEWLVSSGRIVYGAEAAYGGTIPRDSDEGDEATPLSQRGFELRAYVGLRFPRQAAGRS